MKSNFQKIKNLKQRQGLQEKIQIMSKSKEIRIIRENKKIRVTTKSKKIRNNKIKDYQRK